MTVEEIAVGPPANGMVSIMTFDQRELVVILYEALSSQRRPPDIGYEEACAQIRDQAPQSYAVCALAADRVLDWLGNRVRSATAEHMQ